MTNAQDSREVKNIFPSHKLDSDFNCGSDQDFLPDIKVSYHLPGLFEFLEFYKIFFAVYKSHPEFFYDWCTVGSIYGAPCDCIWGGGRTGYGDNSVDQVLDFLTEYGISGRLTFSNSLLREEHLSDKKCNDLCLRFAEAGNAPNGVIVFSDSLIEHLRKNYPGLYLVSSTTKVITDFAGFTGELDRDEFKYVVPDFRLNKSFDRLRSLSQIQKNKTEFLCNECCWTGCKDRSLCYENVSRKSLGEDVPDHICTAPGGNKGYSFSSAMKNPSFIGLNDIKNCYLPMGFTNFKIEGRSLGSAMLLEFLLYYMVKPQFHIDVRELTYLDCMLDLF